MPASKFRRLGLAALTLVTALGLVTVPTDASAAQEPGAVTGRITDAGAPVANVSVELLLAAYPVPVARTVTEASGAFRFESVQAAQYKLRFGLPGGLIQFYPGQSDFAAATAITVAEQGEVTVEESVIAHGSLAGHVSTSAGDPAPQALVGLVKLDGSQVGSVRADQNGDYLLPYLPAGTFDVFVGAAAVSAPRQWAHGHKSRADADPVTVALGQRSTLDERLLPLGTVSGRFTNAGGPVSAVVVYAYSQTSAAESVTAATQSDGTFSLQAYPGTYKVKFQVPGSLDQWADQKELESQADVIALTDGGHVILDQQALPIGRVSGHLSDAAGRPVPGAGVQVSDPDRGRSFEATTDASGGWFATVRPGTYRVLFSIETQAQWAYGRIAPEAADPVTVVAGGETTVDDAFLEPGSLSVTAADARTGAGLSSFCASVYSGYLWTQSCTEDGTADFPALGAGTYSVTVSDGVYLDSVTPGIQVASGRAATFAARMHQGATVAVTLQDAATGAPVDNACVSALPADGPQPPGEGIGDCTYSGGALTLSRVKPGRYQLFAAAYDGTHGSQWVGPDGGVGAQEKARVLDARAGRTIAVTVKLDGRGTIAGAVTDRATGRPIEGALANVWGAAATSDADGRYSLDGLGPYRWAVFVGHDEYAGQWSGGGTNRLTATAIPVRAGQTTAYNVALSTGTTLTGRVLGPGGRLPDSASVTVVHAQTFDTMALSNAGPDGVYRTQMLGPQPVKLLVEASFNGTSVSGWYGGADFAHATTVLIPKTGTKTVDITVG